MRPRDEPGVLIRDAEFTGCYGTRGRPGYSSAALMLVLVLQFVERPTSKPPTRSLRVLTGSTRSRLHLDDTGFDSSILNEFRARLVEHELSMPAFDRILDRCREMDLVKARCKQRTDSTHVISGRRRIRLTSAEPGAPTMIVQVKGDHSPPC
jgi:hypothetical protein